MIKRKRSINSIIHDQLLGYASEEDKKQLQSWLDSSQENRENYDRLMREACLIDRYKQFAQVDEARAWERFQKKHFSIRSARWIKIGRYAAIFLLPIIGFAIWFWTLRLMDSQPVISDEVRIAMIRSEKMGKQKATLVLANGQKMDLKSVPAKPLQDSVEQVPVAQPSVPETDVNESEEVSVVENNKLSTYDDSEFWMTFEDGTRVHLNYNTTLKYPPHFGTTTRTVYLAFSFVERRKTLFNPGLRISSPTITTFFPNKERLMAKLAEINDFPSPLTVEVTRITFLSF